MASCATPAACPAALPWPALDDEAQASKDHEAQMDEADEKAGRFLSWRRSCREVIRARRIHSATPPPPGLAAKLKTTAKVMLGSHITGGPLLTVFPGLGPWAGLWAAGPPPIVIHVSRCTPRLHLAGIFGRASVSSMCDLVRFLRISPVNGIPVLLGVLSFLSLAHASPDGVPSPPIAVHKA
jgi:hypothetical protein